MRREPRHREALQAILQELLLCQLVGRGQRYHSGTVVTSLPERLNRLVKSGIAGAARHRPIESVSRLVRVGFNRGIREPDRNRRLARRQTALLSARYPPPPSAEHNAKRAVARPCGPRPAPNAAVSARAAARPKPRHQLDKMATPSAARLSKTKHHLQPTPPPNSVPRHERGRSPSSDADSTPLWCRQWPAPPPSARSPRRSLLTGAREHIKQFKSGQDLKPLVVHQAPESARPLGGAGSSCDVPWMPVMEWFEQENRIKRPL